MCFMQRAVGPFSYFCAIFAGLVVSTPADAATAPFDISVFVANCSEVKKVLDPETGELLHSYASMRHRQSVDVNSASLAIPAAEGEKVSGCSRTYVRAGERATTFKKLDEMKVNYWVWRSGKADIGNRVSVNVEFTPRSRTYGTRFNFPLELQIPDTDGKIRNGMHYTANLCESEQDKNNKIFTVMVRKADPDARIQEQSSNPYVFKNQACDDSVKDVTPEIRDAACESLKTSRANWCREDNEHNPDLNSEYCTKTEAELCESAYEVKR